MQLSCGHVDIDRMIIQIKDIFFSFGGVGGGEMGAGQRYKARRGTIILISHTLYHPHIISLLLCSHSPNDVLPPLDLSRIWIYIPPAWPRSAIGRASDS